MDPTHKELEAELEEMWTQVTELASTPEGLQMMEEERDKYQEHDQ